MAPTARERLDTRLSALKTERSSWQSHWTELADYVLPRRGRFLSTDRNRGVKKNSRVVNSTATQSVRTTVSGMNAGLTNPSSRWFRLTTEDAALAEHGDVRWWLDQVEEKLYKVFAKSNFYQCMNNIYEELLVFGSVVLWHDEAFETVSRFQALTVGEYMLADNAQGEAKTVYREFDRTTLQLVQEFGLERCSRAVREAYNKGNYDHWHTVRHAVEPRASAPEGLPGARRWPYASVYWEAGAKESDGTRGFLRVSGYEECPAHAGRWDVTSPDVYGRSPGMDVLGDVKQLQALERRRWTMVDRMSGFGPMQGPPAPGGGRPALGPDDYVAVPPGKEFSVRPVYEITPTAVQYTESALREIEARIRSGLFSDLFLMLAQLEKRQMTATEVAERTEEKLLVLGPMVLRANVEVFDPVIDRTFAQLLRASLPRWRAGMPAPLPPPPDELEGQELKIEYVSRLQQSLQQVKIAGINRLVQTALTLAQADPSALDKLDIDQVLDEVATAEGVPARVVRSDDAVAELRAARQQQQLAQQQMMAAQQMAQAAPQVTGAMKDLSEIEAAGASGA